MSAARLALAIDGGGTKTLACVASGGDASDCRLMGCGASGPSNPAAVGVESAKASLRSATREALRAAGISGSSVPAAIIGLAGLEATHARHELQAWMAREFGIADVRVVTDVELLLFAGQRELPAIVLISGTGSTAFGRSGRQLARTGGRGYLLGDEGSGFWIGQRGMIAAMRAMDQAAPATLLVQLIGSRLSAATAEQWTERVYAAKDARQLMAQMSHQVVAAADQGDAVANRILADAASELATLVVSVARQLCLAAQQYDLILAGGILTCVARVRDGLEVELCRQLAPHAARVITVPAEAAACRALEVGVSMGGADDRFADPPRGV